MRSDGPTNAGLAKLMPTNTKNIYIYIYVIYIIFFRTPIPNPEPKHQTASDVKL